jgi:hypothetical protein
VTDATPDEAQPESRPDGAEQPATAGQAESAESRREQADHLRERIYLSFAALAVLLAIDAHGQPEPIEAILTLLVTMLGTLLAVFVADVISFMVVHERTMTRHERQHAVFASFGALGAVGLPFIFLGVAAFGIIDMDLALALSTGALVVTLIVIGWRAVHRVKLNWWQRVVALGAEAALALTVIGLQLIAHG